MPRTLKGIILTAGLAGCAQMQEARIFDASTYNPPEAGAEAGPRADAAAPGLDAAMPPGPAIACTPGEAFCVGNGVWRCTYSGNDACPWTVDCDAVVRGSRCAPWDGGWPVHTWQAACQCPDGGFGVWTPDGGACP